MAKKKPVEVAMQNFVAKHMHEVNKSQVFTDRKKDLKRGYRKYKKGDFRMMISLFVYGSSVRFEI